MEANVQSGWIQIDERSWRYEDGGVRFFLLTGSERAMLVDSGMNVKNVRSLARELTQLPLILFNTHADRDHMAGNGEFDQVWINPAELVNYRAPIASG